MRDNSSIFFIQPFAASFARLPFRLEIQHSEDQDAARVGNAVGTKTVLPSRLF